MRIGVDLDEVMADTISAIVHFHNERYGTNLRKDDFRSYHFWEVWGGTRDEAIKKWYEFLETDHFMGISPIKGSFDALRILKENGHEFFVITARQNEMIEETEKWIGKFFPEIFSSIQFANSYSMVSKGIKKSTLCSQLDINLMIDDDIENAKDVAGSGIKVLLFDRPWNQNESGKNIERVFSWEQITDKIKKQRVTS